MVQMNRVDEGVVAYDPDTGAIAIGDDFNDAAALLEQSSKDAAILKARIGVCEAARSSLVPRRKVRNAALVSVLMTLTVVNVLVLSSIVVAVRNIPPIGAVRDKIHNLAERLDAATPENNAALARDLEKIGAKLRSFSDSLNLGWDGKEASVDPR